MRKFRSHKCPVCGKSYKELGAFNTHISNDTPVRDVSVVQLPDGTTALASICESATVLSVRSASGTSSWQTCAKREKKT